MASKTTQKILKTPKIKYKPINNVPNEYKDRQKQFEAYRTKAFIDNKAYISSDFVDATVEGVFRDDFYKTVKTKIRISDVATQNVTAFEAKKYDDFKEILFAEPKIDYFPPGAKVLTMGSTWLCVNPSNTSSVYTTAIIHRCNTAFNYYDEDGNIKSEPVIVEKQIMQGNDFETPLNMVLPEGYFNVICQKNAVTEKLYNNSRLIFGSSAYHITGFSDFLREFTFDDESIHLMSFTIRREEPTENDDMVNKIANGKILAPLPAPPNAENGENLPYIRFKSPVPYEIKQYKKETLAAEFEGVTGEVEWEFSGADKKSFFVSFEEENDSVSIECLKPSKVPLTVKATVNGESVLTDIKLLGY